MNQNTCKICGGVNLTVFSHTAKCDNCGTLLYYPYPVDDATLVASGTGKEWSRQATLDWYSKSSFHNHDNFTNMIRFAMDATSKGKKLDVLDYGGGGGQFALICKSHFPESTIYITDISDEALLDEWRPLNNQIKFTDFYDNDRKFDYIFLNDVFEHVSDPLGLLKQLSFKLKSGGKLFIDTPKSFWLYPIAKFFSKSLYQKVLRGTVSAAHLQIWTKKSFAFVVQQSNLSIEKYNEISEYTMPPEFYMKNMGIKNPLIKLVGKIFYANAKWLANNKILAVLSSK
jgi:2-polyprenyl-3-methyl-5-hydroxy-6-metoxy-1,4-benzoquinol methylase